MNKNRTTYRATRQMIEDLRTGTVVEHWASPKMRNRAIAETGTTAMPWREAATRALSLARLVRTKPGTPGALAASHLRARRQVVRP